MTVFVHALHSILLGFIYVYYTEENYKYYFFERSLYSPLMHKQTIYKTVGIDNDEDDFCI